jgi:hypothetical protein
MCGALLRLAARLTGIYAATASAHSSRIRRVPSHRNQTCNGFAAIQRRLELIERSSSKYPASIVSLRSVRTKTHKDTADNFLSRISEPSG